MAETPPLVEGYSDLVEVGRGGFARVFRARQDRFKRLVALKVLSLADPDERTRERFERECQAMGELSWHPNVVGVHDSGVTDDGHLWLSMEYLDAGSLADRLSEGRTLDWADAVRVTIEVAGALGAAHAAGTLHRDLKPENLLVGPFGEARLADFGIAAVEGSRRTTTGVASFTVAHVAPEVLRGRRPDERTDLYGLASTLHTLISGTGPYSADPDEPIATVMMRIIETAPPTLGDPVPASLADLLVAGLAKDPADRPESAAAFAEALQEVQREQGLTVTPLRLSPTLGRGQTTAAAPPASDREPTITPDRPDRTEGTAAGDARETIHVGSPPVPPAAPDGAPASLTPSAPGSVPAGEPTRRLRQRRGAFVAIAMALVALLIGAFALTRGGDGGGAAGALVTTEVGVSPVGIAVADDAVWIADSETPEAARLDPATGEVIAVTELDTPSVGAGVSADGAVWVPGTSGRNVSRIDDTTNGVTNLVEVGDDPTSVSAAGDVVWVTTGRDGDAGEAIRIDPATLEVGSRVDLAGGTNTIAATDTMVWVTNSADGAVTRIDPATDEVTATVTVGGDPTGVAVLDESVWVASVDEQAVVRIDPATNEVVATIGVGAIPQGVAATDDAVWVANRDDDTVSRIDPATDEVTDVIDVGDAPVAVAAIGDVVWVANRDDGTVTRIDATSFGT